MKTKIIVKDAEGEFDIYEGNDLMFSSKGNTYQVYYYSLENGIPKKNLIGGGSNHMRIRYVTVTPDAPVKKIDPFTQESQKPEQSGDELMELYQKIEGTKKKRGRPPKADKEIKND